MCNFNPRSREGSDADKVTGETFSVDFNPRSREGSDFIRAIVASFTLISIHAPAKGATASRMDCAPRGCYFNPRSREGSDADQPPSAFRLDPDFNPRSREGSDRFRQWQQRADTQFQSTLPRRERPGARERQKITILISIHAPAKGATPCVAGPWPTSVISIHAPAKGATMKVRLPENNYFISIHAPAKGATMVHGRPDGTARFQSTLPRRERPLLHSSGIPFLQISIHAPAKGATFLHAIYLHIHLFQSTLPRRERRHPGWIVPRVDVISIHAPAKGATMIKQLKNGGKIFQSTLPRRERRYCPSDDHCRTDFNPRSREGSDPVRCLRFSMLHYFNPRSREGSDTAILHLRNGGFLFQSTLPRRERHCRHGHMLFDKHFNPRSREGSDCIQPCHKIVKTLISIHAPAKGATAAKLVIIQKEIFQSTLPRRERPRWRRCWIRKNYFNPRSREGSDNMISWLTDCRDNFNPRSREGSDEYSAGKMCGDDISIHAPAKGATSVHFPIGSEYPISIHAPAKGATASGAGGRNINRFQSTLPRRERQHLLTSFRLQYGYFYFISPIKYSSCFKKIN